LDFERQNSPKETLIKHWQEAIFGQYRPLVMDIYIAPDKT
jgi:hypothetical protein